MRFNPENMQPLGEGGEKKVYIHPEDEEKVVAFFRRGQASSETPASMKGRFYLTKILHLLIPDSIPDIHFASKDGQDATLVSERKHLGEQYDEHNRLFIKAMNGTIAQEEYREMYSAGSDHMESLDNESMEELSTKLYRLGVTADMSATNLGKDKNNNLVYVDNSFRPWTYSKNESLYGDKAIHKFYRPERILELADKLPERDREKALAYLKRLEELYAEEN